MADFLDTVDAILLGRVAYQVFADYWRSSTENMAPKLNALPKIVLSKTLEKVEWNNSRLTGENIKEEILNIKQQPGKDLVLLGGADIASNLLQLGLIDEYRIKDKLTLSLLKTRTFSCGNVILYYQPIVK